MPSQIHVKLRISLKLHRREDYRGQQQVFPLTASRCDTDIIWGHGGCMSRLALGRITAISETDPTPNVEMTLDTADKNVCATMAGRTATDRDY